jgi:hypothetical protein
MEYQLVVDLHDLRAGLAKFRTRRRAGPSDKAILGFDGRFFSIEALDNLFVCNAVGVWPGTATIGASTIVALAAVPPKTDPVTVKIGGDRLSIGSLSVNCKWQSVSQTLMKLPSVPDWVQALSLKYRATRGQIISDGLVKDIARAENNLAKLIRRVGETLSPLGVTETDLQELVDRRMAERHTAGTSPSPKP